MPLRGFSTKFSILFARKRSFVLAKETSCNHVISCSCSCVTMYILDAACDFVSPFFHCQASETIVQKTISIAELGSRFIWVL